MAFLLGGRQALAVAARIAGGRGDGRLTAMERASTWAEYASLAAAGDGGAWADDDGDLPATLLRRAIDDLSAARAAARSGGGSGALTFALASLTKRNHLGIEDAEWYPVGTNGTKRLIDAYVGGARDGGLHLECLAIIYFKEKHPHFENLRRDDHSSKDEPK